MKDMNTKTLVEEIKAACFKNYDGGGNVIVECFTDEEIATEFDSVEAAKEYCGRRMEQALNCRLGTDEDPELEAYKRFEEWK